MKILTVADEESPIYYDYYRPGTLHEFDLILACGDLSASYLEFLVTMANRHSATKRNIQPQNDPH